MITSNSVSRVLNFYSFFHLDDFKSFGIIIYNILVFTPITICLKGACWESILPKFRPDCTKIYEDKAE